MARWPGIADSSTATTRWCCVCRSSASPTGSSPCSPAGTAGCARWLEGSAAPPVKFGARLEPFGHVDLQLAGDPKGNHGSSLHTVSQVEGIELYGKRFLGDYPRYTAASAIAETAERLTPVEREPSLRLFQLTLGALKALARGEHATTLVLDAYLLRGMSLAGWAPALIACAVCGTPGRHRAFSVPAGGAVCPDCRPPGRGPSRTRPPSI